MIAETVRTYAL